MQGVIDVKPEVGAQVHKLGRGNMMADWIANWALRLPPGAHTCFATRKPVFLLQADVREVLFPRLIH